MRIRVRTLMIVVALMAFGFATTDPMLVLLLIFGCPLWFVLFVRMQGEQDAGSADPGGVADGCR